MTHTNISIRGALHGSTALSALALFGAATIAVPTAAFAQETPAPADSAAAGTESEIIVTGSRIQRPDLVASSPVAVVTAEDIKQTNAVTVEQILAVNPQFASGFGQSSNNPGDGSATLNLRGLDEQRTLVLIDGKRAPSYDTQGAVDVNSIPAALIKRIDVLTGGASAVYGSDAIAGVVNFILDDRFQGITADGSSQITSRGDGAIQNLSLTGGIKLGDRGNLVVSGGWSKRNGVFFGARHCCDVTLDSYDLVSSGGSSNTVPTAFDIPGAGQFQVRPGGALSDDVQLYNFNPVNYAQSPFERWNVMGLARYELSDGIEFYGRANYSDVKVALQLAPTATAGFLFNLDPANPFLSPAERSAFFDTGLNPDLIINDGSGVADDPTARAGTSVIGIRRRMVETGGRLENFHTRNMQFVGGFRGDIGSSLHWDVFGQWGQSKKNSVLRNDLSYTALQQALDVVAGPGGQPACFNPANGCVPLNVFDVDSIAPAALAFVLRNAHEKTRITQFIVGANLAGDLGFLRLPWANSPAAFSVGAEYRREKGTTAVDPLYASGDLIYYGQGQNISGKYDVKEIYGELKIPIVEDRAFFYKLGLEAGVRYSDYSTVGSVWTYKAGGDWAPVRGFRFRGIYQRAVRAPNIYELYSPVVAGTGGLGVDPCAGPGVSAQIAAVCIAQGAPPGSIGNISPPISGQINIFTGGNPNLGEETSDTWTVGAVISPARLPGFSASIDYFNIKIKGAISDTPPFITMAQCFDNPNPASPVCLSIVRNPATGSLSGPTFVGVPSTLGNVGAISTNGIDIVTSYRGGDREAFHYAVSFAGTWTHSYKFQADPTSAAEQCAGTFGPICDYEPIPKWKHVAELTLGWKGASFLTRWRHIGKVKADASLSGPDGIVLQTIKSFNYFDETVSFDIGERFNFRVGVMNVFDKGPPIVGDTTGATAAAGGTFPNTYDVLGRAFFAGATVHF